MKIGASLWETIRNSHSFSAHLYSFWLLSQVVWSSHLLQLPDLPNLFQNPFQGPGGRYFSSLKNRGRKKAGIAPAWGVPWLAVGSKGHGMKFHGCCGAVHQPCWWVTDLLWPLLDVHSFGLVLHQLGCAGELSDTLPCGISLKGQWGVIQTQENIPNGPLRRWNIYNSFKVVILLLICDMPLIFAVSLVKQTRETCLCQLQQLSCAYWPFWAMSRDIRSKTTMLAQHLPITSSHRLSWWYLWVEISNNLRECSNIPAGELDKNIVDSISLVVLTVRIHLSDD